MDGLVLNSKLAVGGRGPSPGLLTDHRWRRSGPMSHHRLWGGMDHYVVVTAIMVVVVIATQSSTKAKDRYDHELCFVVHTFSLKAETAPGQSFFDMSLIHFSRLKWAEYLAAG